MKKIFQKLRCLLLGHRYRPGDLKVSYLGETDGFWIYHCENPCINCAQVRANEIRIPIPFGLD